MKAVVQTHLLNLISGIITFSAILLSRSGKRDLGLHANLRGCLYSDCLNPAVCWISHNNVRTDSRAFTGRPRLNLEVIKSYS